MRTLLSCGLLAAPLLAQNTYTSSVDAAADQLAALPGDALLDFTGVSAEFELVGDAQFLERADGTARYSAVVRNRFAIYQLMAIVLEMSGRTTTPPSSGPQLGLLASAYLPAGPIDPGTFRYYPSVTGSMTGLIQWHGASILVTAASACQIGAGANNRNGNAGFSVRLNTQIVTHPPFTTLTPSGPALLAADFFADKPSCATHAETDTGISIAAPRLGFTLPGVAPDYRFIPTGTWREFDDGHAELTGTLRRESDFADQWHLVLTCGSRVDPQDAAHPPAGMPVRGLLAAAYQAQGGPIDPTTFRYYRTATGTLTGAATNAGGVIALSQARPVQVGIGATAANTRFGFAGELQATVITQPLGRTVVLTGNPTFDGIAARACVLPQPTFDANLQPAVDAVSDQGLVLTGQDLAWVEQAMVGPYFVAGTGPEHWFHGYVHVVSNTRLELHLPQPTVPGSYTATLFTSAPSSPPQQVTVTTPSSPRMRSEATLIGGQTQHWIIHKGPLGPAFVVMALSDSLTPSVLPGVVSLGLGAQFSSLLIFPFTISTDPGTGAAVVEIPGMPGLAGTLLHAQAALVEMANPGAAPFPVSDIWATRYR
ncbi:MAG: hypothetical protein IPK26_29760 [Planctomycetes bacterium]|nr:hypothetical protein [Planctomycetota bacterium]